MNPKSLPLLSLVIFGLFFTAAPAAVEDESPIELYYSVNQKVFLVSGFENGLPKLDVEVERSGAPNPERLANLQWQVKGTLPLTPEYAMPLVDYSVHRVAPSYVERKNERMVTVRLDVPSILKNAAWPTEDLTNGFLVFGWIFEAQLREAFVARHDAEYRYNGNAKLVVPEVERDGFPVCWLVAGGVVVKRTRLDAWDPYFFNTETPVDSQALLDGRDQLRSSVVHYAAANGLDSLVERILSENPKLARVTNKAGRSPLGLAVSCAREGAIQRLLSANAPLNDGPSNGNWIVFRATEGGFISVLKALAPERPKSGALKHKYSEALAYALNNNYADQALYLLSLGAKFTVENDTSLVLEKFANGFADLGFELMSRLEVDPNASDQGFNLLHAVAGYADNDLLEKLVNLGCDIRQQTDRGLLPMDIAVGLGNVGAICWFIENGGRNNRESGFVDPVLHAISTGRTESVECLINYGYDMNREISNGVTPLMYATLKGEYSIAEAILRAGGAWLSEHPTMDLQVIRIIQADRVSLLESVINQGWPLDRPIAGEFSLVDAATFFGAEKCRESLLKKGFAAEPRPVLSLKEVDQRPALAIPFRIEYPLDLQRKFGDQEIFFDLWLTSDGRPGMLKFAGDIDAELVQLVEVAVYQLAFEPARKEGKPVPVAMRMKAPLVTQMIDENVFDLADVDEKPSYRRFQPPVYPFTMQKLQATGKVVVEFILTPSGEVLRTRVVSSTHAAFEGPAVTAVEKSDWIPARKNGQPVACRVRIPLTFTP